METSRRKSPPRVSVAVVNYNGREHLDELLQTLDRQTFRDFETLLVDNASSDGSVAYVRNNYPWVRTLPQPDNLGFSRAVNLAARLSTAQYLATLNTDLKLDSGWLGALTRAADADPGLAAVASKILLYHDPGSLNGVGGCMNRLGYTWDRGMFEKDEGQYDEPADVLFASAGAALFRRGAFLAVGGFDERFFMYHEDVDLCWRFWILGHRVATAPKAVAYHHFGASTRQARSLLWRELMGERHNMRSLIKNYQFGNLVRALKDLLLLPQPPRRKLGQLKNLLWNLWALPDTLAHRRRVQSRRRRDDRDLQDLIVESKHVPVRV